VLPLAETCADVGANVVIGTRRRDDAGDLLGRFGAAQAVLDLDKPEYFAEEDHRAAISRRCQRNNVPGETFRCARSASGSIQASAAKTARCGKDSGDAQGTARTRR